jgi:hypothetical protein
MYIQDFIEDIRLSENITHLFKDESECNTWARFAFPLIMFFNTNIYIWTNQNATCQQDSPSGNSSYSSFEQYQYIYVHVLCTQVSDYIYWGTYNTDPDTTTTTSVVVAVLFSLLQAASPWPASSSDKNCLLPEKQKLCFLRLYSSFLFQP